MKKIHISQSRINLFNFCPYAFYLYVIEEKKPIYSNQELIDLGAIIHKVIEFYYSIYPPRKQIDAKVREIYKVISNVVKLPTDLYERGNYAITSFIAFEVKRRLQNDIQPHSEFAIEIDNGEYTEIGILDFFNPDEQIVIDFKVGKTNQTKERDLQMAFYHYLVEKKFNMQPKVYDFYLMSNEMVEVKVTDSLRKELDDIKNRILHSVKTNSFEKCKKNCSKCPFLLYCKGGYNENTTSC